MLSKRNMKVQRIFFCLLLFNFQNLKTYSQDWFEGSLVRSDSEVVVGHISLDPDHDLVLFQKDDSRMVFPAHKIKSVYFYDRGNNINRRYVSLRNDNGIRSVYYLYEIVVAGEVDVLRRKKASAFSTHTGAFDYNYFTFYDEELTPLAKFKRKIYPHLQSKSGKRLGEFVRMNRLSAELPLNAIHIIEYYNGIVRAAEPFARN